MAITDLTDSFVFLAIARDAEGERIEAARWSSDPGDREFAFAALPLRRKRAGAATAKGTLSELTHLEATVRRWSAGRTVIVREANVLRERLEKIGWLSLPPLLELLDISSTVTPRSGRRALAVLAGELDVAPPSPAMSGDTVRAVGEIFDQLLSRIDRYDDGTLERIAILAAQAGWTTAGLLQKIVQQRYRSGPRAMPSGGLTSSELAFMTSRDRPDQLKPTKSVSPIDAEEIARVLSGRGPLSAEVPGFELRAQQVEMAEGVGGVLNEDGWLVAEAGTGTGKSLAYLVPSALHAIERGERVVISTNTRALQDQLIEKEIPAVAAAIGQSRLPGLTASSLKGRANYLCLRRWFGADRQPVRGPADASARAKVHAWLPLTEAGERAELELDGEEERQFDAFSAEGESCVPGRCPFQQKNQCFLYRARRVAEGSHLVVVNHALLLSDLAQGGGVIPDYERVIVDEAHNLEDQATSHFGYSVSESSVWDQLERIIKVDGPGQTGVLSDAATLLMASALTPRSQERAAAGGGAAAGSRRPGAARKVIPWRVVRRASECLPGGWRRRQRLRSLVAIDRSDPVGPVLQRLRSRLRHAGGDPAEA